MKNALSIDLEEYFQIHALSRLIQPDMWHDFPSSIEDNTMKILDLLEKFHIIATFFCLGWIAEHHRGLIKQIHNHGHEVACHGFAHQVIYQQDKVVFRDDVSRAKNILEDIIGAPVIGYRAPTYSITDKTLWALAILEDLGFKYDSSIFPIYHDTYGMPHAPRFPYRLPDSTLVEFPVSTLKVGPINIPVSGGGYFRLFPYLFTKIALKTLMHSKNPFVFYIHPWELNPDTPLIAGMDVRSRFRTYVGIGSSFQRFTTLLQDFSFAPIRDVLTEMNLLS
jgi:polysaccharide deacetylase family protein (PEP-CTERM system associated)